MKMTVESLLKGEPLPEYNLGNVRVLLDEKEVADVIELDTEERYLIKYKRDAKGDLVLNRGDVDTETLHGKVEVVAIKEEVFNA
ncbi:hypothetical protein M316_0087 [Nitrincola phage 1M3-16]|uniref:hypothetical protein n=1 Tax=Nitrincola phage 1M3-16 TaxID=1472912 RepID=UPI000444C315|nr:hypothetical protein GJ22_gp065 [Nitrincola phage 1M3-16]AHX01152.1 hypothetical protein M316_0087 [Nitrincola phage 1M3-16]